MIDIEELKKMHAFYESMKNAKRGEITVLGVMLVVFVLFLIACIILYFYLRWW